MVVRPLVDVLPLPLAASFREAFASTACLLAPFPSHVRFSVETIDVFVEQRGEFAQEIIARYVHERARLREPLSTVLRSPGLQHRFDEFLNLSRGERAVSFRAYAQRAHQSRLRPGARFPLLPTTRRAAVSSARRRRGVAATACKGVECAAAVLASSLGVERARGALGVGG